MNQSSEIQHLLLDKVDQGITSLRRPGTIMTPAGTLLLYYDIRDGEGASSIWQLVAHRSTDSGKTFQRLILETGKPGCEVHNAVMLSGLDDEVHLLWNTNHDSCFYRHSADGGKTWGGTRNLTPMLEACRNCYPWKVLSVGPGHGIRLSSGRLVVPLWLSKSESHKPSAFASFYSDDNGQTWSVGQMLEHSKTFVNPNEGAITEISGGRLLATIRHDTLPRRRALSISKDQGLTWSPAILHDALPDPICFGSLISLPKQTNTVLLSNCAWDDPDGATARQNGSTKPWSDDARKNLIVRLSSDEGKTWSDGLPLTKEGGYSDLAVSTDGNTVFCIYETCWQNGQCIFPGEICFAKFLLKKLK